MQKPKDYNKSFSTKSGSEVQPQCACHHLGVKHFPSPVWQELYTCTLIASRIPLLFLWFENVSSAYVWYGIIWQMLCYIYIYIYLYINTPHIYIYIYIFIYLYINTPHIYIYIYIYILEAYIFSCEDTSFKGYHKWIVSYQGYIELSILCRNTLTEF